MAEIKEIPDEIRSVISENRKENNIRILSTVMVFLSSLHEHQFCEDGLSITHINVSYVATLLRTNTYQKVTKLFNYNPLNYLPACTTK